MSMKLLGVITVGSVITDLLQIRFSTFGRYYRKNGSIMGWCISYLLTSRKPMTGWKSSGEETPYEFRYRYGNIILKRISEK
jgi:hypothetical protein